MSGMIASLFGLFRGARLTLHRGPRTDEVDDAGEAKGAITVEDEGIALDKVEVIDFKGAGVTAALVGATAEVTIPGAADQDYDTLQARGTAAAQRATANFEGPFQLEDDGGNTRTNIKLRGFAEPDYHSADAQITHYQRFLDDTAPYGWIYTSPASAPGIGVDGVNGNAVRVTTDNTTDALIETEHNACKRNMEPEYGGSLMPVGPATGWRLQAGLMNAVGAAGTEQGCYFRYVDGNWIAVTRDGAGETTTDTGVAPDSTNHQALVVECRSGDVRFWIDGTLEATHSTNLITATTELQIGAAVRRASGVLTGYQIRCGSMGFRHRIHS